MFCKSIITLLALPMLFVGGLYASVKPEYGLVTKEGSERLNEQELNELLEKELHDFKIEIQRLSLKQLQDKLDYISYSVGEDRQMLNSLKRQPYSEGIEPLIRRYKNQINFKEQQLRVIEQEKARKR